MQRQLVFVSEHTSRRVHIDDRDSITLFSLELKTAPLGRWLVPLRIKPRRPRAHLPERMTSSEALRLTRTGEGPPPTNVPS